MLARNSLGFNGFKVLVAAGLLSGCVVTETTGSGPTTGGATTGAGGEGGQTTATTATTSSATTAGTGGAACVGETGKAVVADCDALNITPSNHGGGAAIDCGDNLDQEPPGYGFCVHAFDI